jgi:glyoxylase-like metal-dependent hydrolase (beta-lactamase superfamily II)
MLEDGWYQVEALDEATFAIGEPRYHQQNWSYLLVGTDRSLLFDTGSYFGDITGVVARRAKGRLTALPSHMHYDHLGNVTRFAEVALPDLPVLRACAVEDGMTPSGTLFLGHHEDREAPSFPVAEWLPVGAEIDLGGRVLRLIHTPGHSPDSVSLWEPGLRRLYAADFLYRGPLYAQTPGAALADYLTAARAVAGLVGEAAIYGAHGDARPGETAGPPRLDAPDLAALVVRLEAIRAAPPALAAGETREYPVSRRMRIIVGAEALAGFATG